MSPQRAFNPIVSTMDDDFITRQIGRSEKRNALDVIVMKMGEEQMKGFFLQALSDYLLAEGTQTGSSVENQKIFGIRFHVHAGSIPTIGRSVAKRELFFNEFSNLAFRP